MKNVLWILIFLMTITAIPHLGLSSELDLSYTKLEYKNMDYTETSTLYHRMMDSSQIPLTFKNLHKFTLDEVSTSVTSQAMAQEFMIQSTQVSLSQAFSKIKRYFRNNIRNSLLPDLDAAPSTPMQNIPAFFSSPNDTLEKNKFTPKVNIGTDYVKPVLYMGNPLNSGIDTHVSYHSKDKNLEAVVSRKLSKDMKVLIKNINLFSANNEKRVIFGIQYRF